MNAPELKYHAVPAARVEAQLILLALQSYAQKRAARNDQVFRNCLRGTK